MMQLRHYYSTKEKEKEKEKDLLVAASWSSKTVPKSLCTAMQSLSLHCLADPEAPFLKGQKREIPMPQENVS